MERRIAVFLCLFSHYAFATPIGIAFQTDLKIPLEKQERLEHDLKRELEGFAQRFRIFRVHPLETANLVSISEKDPQALFLVFEKTPKAETVLSLYSKGISEPLSKAFSWSSSKPAIDWIKFEEKVFILSQKSVHQGVLTTRLEKPDPWYLRSSTWVAAGLVVAGVVVAISLNATSESDPGFGAINNGFTIRFE